MNQVTCKSLSNSDIGGIPEFIKFSCVSSLTIIRIGKTPVSAVRDSIFSSTLNSPAGAYLSILSELVKSDGQTEQEFISKLRTNFAEHVSQPEFVELKRAEKTEALYQMVVN